MRPYRAAIFVALSLGVIFLCPAWSQNQAQAQVQDQPSDAKRKIVSRVVPAYPELASKMQIVGTVKVEVVVAPSGKVKLTQVVGGNPVLVKSAVDAVEKWRWVPGPAETKELLELNFHP